MSNTNDFYSRKHQYLYKGIIKKMTGKDQQHKVTIT